MSAEETPKQAAEELQKFYVTRHEWYEARYSVTYEVKAATHEEAVKELERYDETGSEDNCRAIVIDLIGGNPAGELPLETDETATVLLQKDIDNRNERLKVLPIKPVYNIVEYSEQLSFVLAYVVTGHDGELTPQWVCLGIFRNEDKAKEAVQKYADSNGSLWGHEVQYYHIKEGEALPGVIDLSDGSEYDEDDADEESEEDDDEV